MEALAKSVTRLLGKRREGESAGGSRSRDFPPELLQHIERQCALWEGMSQRLCNHVTLLGTDNMVHYTEEERKELDLMIRNMQEFASHVDGALKAKVSHIALTAQKALASYDQFCHGGKNTTKP